MPDINWTVIVESSSKRVTRGNYRELLDREYPDVLVENVSTRIGRASSCDWIVPAIFFFFSFPSTLFSSIVLFYDKE